MKTLTELDTVVLARDLRDQGLCRGDIGTIVHRYPGGRLFEVEFVTSDGETVAVESLSKEDIRPRERGEILHSRKVAT